MATKGGWTIGRPDVLRAEIEESLRRLRTDSTPLYYLHRPDPEMPVEDSLAAIKEYQDSGNIRSIGLSNVGLDQLQQAREVVAISAVQNHYNLSERRHEDIVDYGAEEGIVFVPYFPLRGEGGRPLVEIAERHQATREQITLAWLLRRSPTVLPIPGNPVSLAPEGEPGRPRYRADRRRVSGPAIEPAEEHAGIVLEQQV